MFYNEESVKKFNNYLELYIKLIKREIRNVSKVLRKKELKERLGDTIIIEKLLEERDSIIALESSLESNLNIIQFLYENGAEDADQFRENVEAIVNSDALSFNEEDIVNADRSIEELNSRLEKTNQILYSDDYDFLYLTELLEESDLDENEKIDVLSKIALDSCEKELDDVVDMSILDDTQSSLSDRDDHEEIIKEVNALIDKHYHLIEGKNPTELRYAIELAKFDRERIKEEDSEEIDFSSFQYPEETMIALIIDLKDTKKIVEESISNKANVDDYLDYLKLLMEDVRKIEKEINLNEEDKKELTSKVAFLLDDNQQPFFNIDDFSKDDKKRIKNIISKFEKGLFDYYNVKTKKKTDYNIYSVRDDNVICTYIKVKDVALIINFGTNDKVYKEVNKIVDKNDELIKANIDRLKDNLEGVISDQKPFTDDLDQKLNGGIQL